ncbi:MAG: MBL fold metallo-hydrolase [Acidobacteria bacterium]|jgi:phosphoribosyl 1,2-cyclic phosphate phosphodiesterase|nr:MBL fold metallo-hydrolase [Acidobacteriota bacterium]
MNVLFLGTGTSHGVPMIGCDCGVCRSTDARDKRLRPSIYLELDDGVKVLVDTTPDLRQQALTHDLRQVDAVLYTHSHADHVLGLDEVRRYNHMSKAPMPLYGDAATLADLRRMFAYVFEPASQKSGGVPRLCLSTIVGPFCLGTTEIQPLTLYHGGRPVLGFRIGRFAYLTDCNRIPDETMAQLEGLEVLVLDALRRKKHPTHFSLDEAVVVARRVRARQTLFTHCCHDLGHAETCASLPEGITLAYDGLRIACT